MSTKRPWRVEFRGTDGSVIVLATYSTESRALARLIKIQARLTTPTDRYYVRKHVDFEAAS